MKTIFFQGAFDLLNFGHVQAFELAKSKGDYLIVGLNSDELMRWYKREPIVPYEQRLGILSAIKWIDKIICCHEPAAIRYLKEYDADVYVLTEEWTQPQREAIEWITAKGGEVVFSPRFKNAYDSTTIRQRVIEGARND